METLKKNWMLISVVLVVFVLGAIAIVTATRLYQTQKEPIAPTAPSSKPKAVEAAQSISLNRFLSSDKKDHAESTKESLNGFVKEGSLGYLLQKQADGTAALFTLYRASPADYMISRDSSEGKSAGYNLVETLGYIYTTSQPGTVPLYRLYNGRDHMASKDANEGAPAFHKENILGYILVSPPTSSDDSGRYTQPVTPTPTDSGVCSASFCLPTPTPETTNTPTPTPTTSTPTPTPTIPTSTPTPTLTSTPTPGLTTTPTPTNTPTPGLTSTPTPTPTTITQVGSPTPTPTSVTLPSAGISLPTWGAFLGGLLLFGMAAVLLF